MLLSEAKKYITSWNKKKVNPYLWPDYLTGLPDKAAIIKKLDEAFPKLGEYSIVYLRIANINPYLLKYGHDKHAEIIQWAAAILKICANKSPDGFVGTLNTHDFVGICKTQNDTKHFEEAREKFRKKVSAYYSKKDLAKGVVFSFDGKDGKKINMGLMKLIAVVADKKLPVKKINLIQSMTKICNAIEGTEDEIVFMSNTMIQRD